LFAVPSILGGGALGLSVSPPAADKRQSQLQGVAFKLHIELWHSDSNAEAAAEAIEDSIWQLQPQLLPFILSVSPVCPGKLNLLAKYASETNCS